MCAARKCLGQTVEHVIEGVRQHAHPIPTAADTADARMQIASVDPRGDRRHLSQRSRDTRANEIGGQERDQSRQGTGEHERSRHAVLGARDRPQWLAYPERYQALPAAMRLGE